MNNDDIVMDNDRLKDENTYLSNLVEYYKKELCYYRCIIDSLHKELNDKNVHNLLDKYNIKNAE